MVNYFLPVPEGRLEPTLQVENGVAGPQILAVIPARFQSRRLPGKPLLHIGAQTMLERVWQRVRRARRVTAVAVATDDARIFDAALSFGASVFLTDPAHNSGTDRVAEVAAKHEAAIVVNVQGDEPFLEPASIDEVVEPLLADESVLMSTLKTPLRDPAEAADPNVVKVITDRHGNALYFSRLPIPYRREGRGLAVKGASVEAAHFFKHLGLYAYRRDFLLGYSRLPRGPLEAAEKLEQLRALENGYSIRVVETAHDSLGVDTEQDLARARAMVEV